MNNKGSLFLPVVAVLVTIAAVWYTQHPAALRQTNWDDVVAEAKAGGYTIISTEELADRHKKRASDLLLVDTRQEWEYRTGHIEDALNFPMEPTWWARWRKAGALKNFLGSDKNRFIVIY
jgi:hypothetical protein